MMAGVMHSPKNTRSKTNQEKLKNVASISRSQGYVSSTSQKLNKTFFVDLSNVNDQEIFESSQASVDNCHVKGNSLSQLKNKENQFMKCSICEKKIPKNNNGNPGIFCKGKCKRNFHLSCTKEYFSCENDMSVCDMATWQCIDCVKDTLYIDKSTLSQMSVQKQLEIMIAKSADIMNAYQDVQRTVLKYQEVISQFMASNEELKKENEELKTRLVAIESRMDMNNDNMHEDLIINYEKMKQDLKKDEIEIWGVKEFENENLMETVTQLASKFEVDIATTDVNFAFRLKSKIANKNNIPNPIRVKFYNRRKRDLLIDSSRKMRIKNDDNADERNGRNFIYINESLTKHNEFVFGRVRELKRRKVIEKGWCKNGKIFIQMGNHPPKLINKIEDLDGFQ